MQVLKNMHFRIIIFKSCFIVRPCVFCYERTACRLFLKIIHQSERRLDGSMSVVKLQLWPFLAATLLLIGHILVRVDFCTLEHFPSSGLWNTVCEILTI